MNNVPAGTAFFVPSREDSADCYEFLFALHAAKELLVESSSRITSILRKCQEAGLSADLWQGRLRFTENSDLLHISGKGLEDVVVVSRDAPHLIPTCGNLTMSFLPIPPSPKGWLPHPANKRKKQKIAVIGAESTGKSTLASLLAEHFAMLPVGEYVRFLLDGRKETTTTAEDLALVIRGQVAWEESVSFGTDRGVICDTEPRQTLAWRDFLFEHATDDLFDWVLTRTYDAYLLCAADVPWVNDPQRCMPEGRDQFNKRLETYVAASPQTETRWMYHIAGDFALRQDIARAALRHMTSLMAL